MPARSIEALERKKQRRKARRAAFNVTIEKSDWPCYKIQARRMRPRLRDNMTKAELREMLAQAVANTTVNR